MKAISKIFPIILLCTPVVAAAQEFSIRKVEMTGESIILHYDLVDTVKARTYTIDAYSSTDSYLSPLKQVKGDVGLEVKPGTGKKITWSSREELGTTFKGDIEIE